MSTTVKPELSPKSKYWIERHRYYELKHFCMQYPIWKRERAALSTFAGEPLPVLKKEAKKGDPTADCAIKRAFYSARIEMLERVAEQTDPILSRYLLKGVTEGLSYSSFQARFGIPCGKEAYYDLYRRFFWLLDKERQ